MCESKHIVISVGCEYASGGTQVGKLLSEKLGIEYFDREFIDQIIERVGVSQHALNLADAGEAVKGLSSTNPGGWSLKYADLTDRLVYIQKEVVKKLAARTSCVIIGRCADYILKDRSDVLNVFIYAPMEARIRNVRQAVGCTREEAEKLIEENDRMYHARYKQITGTYRGDRHNRDILIDAELLGVERTADYLESLVKTLESEGKFDGE